jgi:hypothetical protein
MKGWLASKVEQTRETKKMEEYNQKTRDGDRLAQEQSIISFLCPSKEMSQNVPSCYSEAQADVVKIPLAYNGSQVTGTLYILTVLHLDTGRLSAHKMDAYTGKGLGKAVMDWLLRQNKAPRWLSTPDTPEWRSSAVQAILNWRRVKWISRDGEMSLCGIINGKMEAQMLACLSDTNPRLIEGLSGMVWNAACERGEDGHEDCLEERKEAISHFFK